MNIGELAGSRVSKTARRGAPPLTARVYTPLADLGHPPDIRSRSSASVAWARKDSTRRIYCRDVTDEHRIEVRGAHPAKPARRVGQPPLEAGHENTSGEGWASPQ